MEQSDADTAACGAKDDEDRFLELIGTHAELPRHVTPATAATVTICTLADRLTPGQAHRLLEAFPPHLQPLFASCTVRAGRPIARFDDADFLEQLATRFGVTPGHAELVGDSVFRAARDVLPAEVVDHVATQLPKDLRDLWLGTRSPLAGVVTITEDDAQQELLLEIADRVPLPVGVSAPDALSAVMCAFSDRLSGGEARDVFLGLPHAVRPLVERCLVRRGEQAAVFDRHTFVARVADDLETTPDLAQQIVDAVLTAIKRFLPMKEQDDVASQLPPDLRETWQSA